MKVSLSNGVVAISLCGAALLPRTVAFSTSTSRVPPSRNTPRRHSVRVLAAATTTNADLLQEIRDEIMEREGDLQAWEDSVKILSELFDSSDSSDAEEAELYVADAFRWKAWASASTMMRKYQRPVLPDADKIREGLTWLKEGPLEMSEFQIRSNIEQYPGIYLREPHVFYKKVMGSAPRKYRSDEVLKHLIEDDPTILQVTFNCGDEGCQSECGSCWVAYENRLPSIPNL